MSKEAKSTEKAENGNVFIADIRCSATIGNTLNKQTSTDTTFVAVDG